MLCLDCRGGDGGGVDADPRFDDYVDWVFDINVVPGIFAGVVLALMLRDRDAAHSARVDIPGLLFLAAGLGSMQYVLTEGEQHYWFADQAIVFFTVLMIASLCALVAWELFGTRNPMVNLRILRNRSVAAGSGLARHVEPTQGRRLGLDPATLERTNVSELVRAKGPDHLIRGMIRRSLWFAMTRASSVARRLSLIASDTLSHEMRWLGMRQRKRHSRALTS